MKIKLLKYFITCLLLVGYSLGFSQNNTTNGSYGFIVTNLETGKNIVETNATICFTPASVTKIITTATALELLGENFRFKTDIAFDGKIENSVLKGNLYIVGGGDGTLCSKYFSNSDFTEKVVETLIQRGIHKIEGNIIADASIFDKEPLPTGWTMEDIGNYYAAGVFGISIFDNMLNVAFRSKGNGSVPEIIAITPNIKHLEIENNLKAKKGVGDNARFFGMPYDNYRQVFGEIEANCDSFVIKSDLPNPPLAAAQYLLNVLTVNNIEVTGVATGVVPKFDKRAVLCTHFSSPLSEIIKNVNYVSNNNLAEYLLKYLSLQIIREGNFETGLNVLKNFWKSKGINTETLFMLDGSGLSPHNAFSPEFLNNVLIFMAKDSRNFDVFFNSLPIAGESGTIHNLLKTTKLSGKAHLKSGSISRVQCYAGYIVDNDQKYSMVIMVNNFAGNRKSVVKIIENMIVEAIK